LIQIDEWWNRTKNIRISIDKDDYEDLIIGKYGKNYFSSYLLQMKNGVDCSDDASMEILYERFVKDVKDIANENSIVLSLATFKSDSLFVLLNDKISITNKQQDIAEIDENILEEIKNILNEEGQSSYSFSKAIADYVVNNAKVTIDYFRVISRTNKKCREAFPLPSSSFMELVNRGEEEYPPFLESGFYKSILKKYPVFIVDKDDAENKSIVTNVDYIRDFSFNEYIEDAQKVYDKTIDAFKFGDENLFPKSGDGLMFHVRSKAVNAEDTFQFTNGMHLTKRTFWANKGTVDSLIEKQLKKNR